MANFWTSSARNYEEGGELYRIAWFVTDDGGKVANEAGAEGAPDCRSSAVVVGKAALEMRRALAGPLLHMYLLPSESN